MTLRSNDASLSEAIAVRLSLAPCMYLCVRHARIQFGSLIEKGLRTVCTLTHVKGV